MSLLVVSVVLPWIVVALGCWLSYQLVQQNGRILLRLETLQEQLAQLSVASRPTSDTPRGLALGTPAPAFELPDLNSNLVPLEQFRGQQVLLIFFSPNCGFCRQMAPALAALPCDGGDGRLIPLIVTTGSFEENRKLIEEHEIRCPVLLQTGMEVAAKYKASGTPMGYLIDSQGVIASELVMGANALLELAAATSPPENEDRVATNTNGHRAYRGNRSLTESRINRNGLSTGTPAPTFCLPRLDGGELSLEEYRGKPVLLVFSDPDCGPCNELIPELEHIHRTTPVLQVLMVSRGDQSASRSKLSLHGITFPVALQRHWEISRAYGMFATPCAYLIDMAGNVAADVAVGADAIRALVADALEPAPRREVMPMR